jgi:hypothetical protein
MSDKTLSKYNIPCDVPDTWQGFLDLAAAHKHNQVAPISCSQIEYLAQCPCYEREAGDMTAAHRGTALHQLMSLPDDLWPMDLPDTELAALREARAIERELIIPVAREVRQGGGLHDFGGTTDLTGHTKDGKWTVCDYKFGGNPVRSDSLQLIAYAVLVNACQTLVIQPGCKPFLHTVTGEDIVDRLAPALERCRGKEPTSCELCSKCAKRETCPALRQDLAIVAAMPDPKTIALPTDPGELGRLMCQVDAAETICETLRSRIKALLVAGGDVTGWKLTHSKKQQTAWKQIAEKRCTVEEIASATSFREEVAMRRSK